MPGYMSSRHRMKNPLIRPMPALLPLLLPDFLPLLRYFDSLTFSSEDRQRADFYASSAQRVALKQ